MDPTLIDPAIGWSKDRRFRAYELHQHGWKQQDIAAALGVTPGAVSQQGFCVLGKASIG